MHPILGRRNRLRAYLAAWIPLGLFLAALVHETQGLSLLPALLLVVLPTAVFAFVCLAAWFPCRALPLPGRHTGTVLLSHALSAVFAAGIWVTVGFLWAAAWSGSTTFSDLQGAWRDSAFLVLGLGFVLYLLSVAVHYLLNAQEQAAQRQRQVLLLDMLAQQAELKALKAQVQPHFLFNSLNSISALTADDPGRAREMCLKLADLLRASLTTSKPTYVTLERELELVRGYLEIEKVRFGDRLGVEEQVEPTTLACLVPPLLLQPLVENAVLHGIAQRLEGGEVRLTARRDGQQLELSVENPVDAESPRRAGEGVGLENVRRRLEGLYRGAGRMDVREGDGRFCVDLALPAEEGR